jgi:hypothetical protein
VCVSALVRTSRAVLDNNKQALSEENNLLKVFVEEFNNVFGLPLIDRTGLSGTVRLGQMERRVLARRVRQRQATRGELTGLFVDEFLTASTEVSADREREKLTPKKYDHRA